LINSLTSEEVNQSAIANDGKNNSKEITRHLIVVCIIKPNV
jgi:hypothetical protein